MTRKLTIVNDPEYWRSPVRPLNYQAWKDMHEGKTCGFWQITQHRNGVLIAELWVKNKLTNKGVQAALKNTFAASGGTVNPFKYIAITNLDGVTNLTTALTNGQSGITSLAVDALTGAIASGTTLTIGAGTGTTQNVTVSSTASSGATSISVNSFTANAAYAIGTTVAPQPAATDDPSALGTTTSYSAAISSFTYGTTDVSFSASFTTGGGATAGTYTGAYVTNTSPVSGTGQTAVHITFDNRKTLGSSDTITINIDETITPQ